MTIKSFLTRLILSSTKSGYHPEKLYFILCITSSNLNLLTSFKASSISFGIPDKLVLSILSMVYKERLVITSAIFPGLTPCIVLISLKPHNFAKESSVIVSLRQSNTNLQKKLCR
jgi:hypothetical protein